MGQPIPSGHRRPAANMAQPLSTAIESQAASRSCRAKAIIIRTVLAFVELAI